jgi:hypothetical protein
MGELDGAMDIVLSCHGKPVDEEWEEGNRGRKGGEQGEEGASGAKTRLLRSL